MATVQLVSGASFIYRESQERYIPIKFSVRGRDLGGAVLEAQRKVARTGAAARAATVWNGSASSANCRTRSQRLSLVVPLSLALICVLLYINFGSLTDTAAGRERHADGAGRRHLRALR